MHFILVIIYYQKLITIILFFSSRRRHTRSYGDWSSDVCSSDLVYLHAPFCSSKCHFCDWVVGYDKTDLIDAGDLRQRYVQAICTQLRSYGPRLSELGYAVTNIYWGGGTPTRLTPEQLTQVRGALGEVFDLSSVSEHTAECSPEDRKSTRLNSSHR